MDLVTIIIAGVALLSLVPVLFILYALLSDTWLEDQPAAWELTCTEHFREVLTGRTFHQHMYPGLFREMCKASSKAYFQVQSLSKAVWTPGRRTASVSEMVLERNSEEVWHSITQGDQHAEVAVCLYNRDGDQLLLTHRLWTN